MAADLTKRRSSRLKKESETPVTGLYGDGLPPAEHSAFADLATTTNATEKDNGSPEKKSNIKSSIAMKPTKTQEKRKISKKTCPRKSEAPVRTLDGEGFPPDEHSAATGLGKEKTTEINNKRRGKLDSKSSIMERSPETPERRRTPKKAGSGKPQDGGNRRKIVVPLDVDPENKIRNTITQYSRNERHGVEWSDISGLDTAKNTLKEAIVLPSIRPDIFSGLREPPYGMLLFGPPGTGKTMLARAVATEAKSTFFSLSSATMISSTYGGNEKLVNDLFVLAKLYAPSIIFIDEVDALLSRRGGNLSEHESSRRTKNEFLTQWSSIQCPVASKEGQSTQVFILGATNLPWSIDEAARRRFTHRQYIPLPDCHEREDQLRNIFKRMSPKKHKVTDSDFSFLACKTEGFSYSDITNLAKDAAMGPLRKLGDEIFTINENDIPPITIKHFEASLTSIRPSVSQHDLSRYIEWTNGFGRGGI